MALNNKQGYKSTWCLWYIHTHKAVLGRTPHQCAINGTTLPFHGAPPAEQGLGVSARDGSCWILIPSLDKQPVPPREQNQETQLPLLSSIPGLGPPSARCLHWVIQIPELYEVYGTRLHQDVGVSWAGGSPGAALYFTHCLPPPKGNLKA